MSTAAPRDPRYLVYMPLHDLLAARRNPKAHATEAITASIEDHGVVETPAIDERTGRLVAGHGRRGALQRMKQAGNAPPDGVTVREDGEWMIPVLRGWASRDDDDAEKYLLASNQTTIAGGWIKPELTALLADLSQRNTDLVRTGFGQPELTALLSQAGGGPRPVAPSLRDRFLVPPFSVLDARQGYWQDRKRAWLAIGIKSEVGRGGDLLALESAMDLKTGKSKRKADARTFGQDIMRGEHVVGQNGDYDKRKRPNPHLDEDAQKALGVYFTKGGVLDREGGESQTGTSIFDPVLCELAYRWFVPTGGAVLDPFAGGSVRGIVAARLGYRYTGIELRGEQIAANVEQWEELRPSFRAPIASDPAQQPPDAPDPRWIEGDSRNAATLCGPDAAFDFIFSCPPYADLERYSDDPRDLSTMEYDAFHEVYRKIIAEAVRMLRPNRFACFVVGDVRAPSGVYRNFVSHTIAAFHDAGAALYNEMILVTSVGSLPIRAGKQFSASRKAGKTHQNVLVFVKGDPKKATQACGEIDVTFPLEETEA